MPKPEYAIVTEGEKVIVKKIINGAVVKEYIVQNGHCSCPAYLYRGTCKHLRMIEEKEKGG